MNTIFKVFWYDYTRGINPRFTDCDADALTTTPSHRFNLASFLHLSLFHKLVVLISPFDFVVFVWRAGVLVRSIIDCLLFVTYGIVTGVRWAGMLAAIDTEHVRASYWVGFSFIVLS